MRYKFLKNKLLSVLLIAIMMLSLLPVPALAAVTAHGTAEAEAGRNEIYITLTGGEFAFPDTVNVKGNWTLGGASAADNPISSVYKSVKYSNSKYVVVTLTNLIKEGDEYTITALPAVFDTGVEPFASPLEVTVAPNASPSFAAGYPKGGTVFVAGSKRLEVVTGALSEPSYFYFVVVQNMAAVPNNDQIKAGQDSTGKPAFYSYKTDNLTHSLMTNFSFPLAEDDTDYDFYFVLKDATGYETFSGPLTLKTPPERTEDICIYNDTQGFTKIEEAISWALESGGGTIKLLDHIYLHKPVVIDKSVDINFDLNGKYFSISTAHLDMSTALEVSGGASVTYTGDTDDSGFYAAGAERGVEVTGNSHAAVTYAESTGDSGIAAAASSDSSITINGDVYAAKWSTGVHASDGGTAVVNGDVYVTGDGSTGIDVAHGGSVTVNGDIIAQKAEDTDGYLKGVYISVQEPVFYAYKSSISAEASVIVNGNIIVEGDNSWGVFARGGSVAVNGSIGVEGIGSFGIDALDGGMVTVTAETGNSITMTGNNCLGINAVGSIVAITGNIDTEGNECRGISAQYGSTVSIEGNIFFIGNDSYGIYADGYDTVVTIDGNIYGNDDDEDGIEDLIGVYVGEFADVTVTDDVAVSGIRSIGVYADDIEVNGGSTTVEGSVYAEGASCVGVKADGYQSIVTVKENVAASGDSSMGVYASGSGMVTINGNVYQDGEGYGGGIYCLGNTEDLTTVTVGGTLIALNENDIKIGEGWRPQDSPGFGEPDPEKPGYIKYSDDDDPEAIVWISGSIVPSEKIPTVVTKSVSDVTTCSAIFSGEVTSDGGSHVTEQGFVYGTTAIPDVYSGITVKVSTGTSIFSAKVSSLKQDTTYHVRAYAINDQGTAYGNNVSFKTGDTPSPPPDNNGSSSSRVIKLPTVVTEKVLEITALDAMLSGNVTSDGGSEVTLRGFVYGTDSNPTLDTGIKINVEKGIGAFNFKLTGLFSGTDYHVRAFAVNSKGTAYGKDVLFTTSVPSSGEAGYLDASKAQSPYGCVVLYTDLEGKRHIVGLSDVEGDIMKYISRGPGKYEIIFNAKPFNDIEGHWAKNDIDYNSARLLFDGVSPEIFAPDIPVTRGMLTAVLGRMYGIDTSLYSGHSFDDVNEEIYYAPYIKWAAENSIVYGISEKLFEPERPVTRQEMASMLHRFMILLGINAEKVGVIFADDNMMQDWAHESVMSLQASGIINGKPGNLFEPDSYTTRGETAAMLRRLIEYILK